MGHKAIAGFSIAASKRAKERESENSGGVEPVYIVS